MKKRTTAAFTTRPGIAACALGDIAVPLATFADRARVAAMLCARGMSAATAEAKASMFASCASALSDVAIGSAPAHAFFVPGRIEVLGKHTDYCGGRSLLCTVERGFCLVAVARNDAVVQLVNVATGERVSFPLSSRITPRVGHWTNYAMTVARRVAANFGDDLRGCDVAFVSDLPQAAGLSSSSAFVVGTFLILSAINALPAMPAYRDNIRSTEDLANYLGCCENGSTFGTLVGTAGVGTFGGSQDHTAILCCRPDMLSMFSFCPVRREADVRLPDRVSLHVAPTGVIAEKTGAAMDRYNAVSGRARQIVERWNAATGARCASLNDVVTSSPGAVDRLRSMLDADATQRLDQFLIESNRLIPAAARLIAAGEWDAIGPLIDESQSLAETHLRNQVDETIALQRQMRDAGAMAASAFGAGFGGSVWGMFLQG